MSIEIANLIVNAGLVYAGLGLVFGLAFVWKGAGRLDPDAARGTWGFRLLILPGSAALWPLLLLRWVRSSGPPQETSPHRSPV